MGGVVLTNRAIAARKGSDARFFGILYCLAPVRDARGDIGVVVLRCLGLHPTARIDRRGTPVPALDLVELLLRALHQPAKHGEARLGGRAEGKLGGDGKREEESGAP